MTFAKPHGKDYVAGDVITPGEVNAIQDDLTQALDGYHGGTYVFNAGSSLTLQDVDFTVSSSTDANNYFACDTLSNGYSFGSTSSLNVKGSCIFDSVVQFNNGATISDGDLKFSGSNTTLTADASAGVFTFNNQCIFPGTMFLQGIIDFTGTVSINSGTWSFTGGTSLSADSTTGIFTFNNQCVFGGEVAYTYYVLNNSTPLIPATSAYIQIPNSVDGTVVFTLKDAVLPGTRVTIFSESTSSVNIQWNLSTSTESVYFNITPGTANNFRCYNLIWNGTAWSALETQVS